MTVASDLQEKKKEYDQQKGDWLGRYHATELEVQSGVMVLKTSCHAMVTGAYPLMMSNASYS